MSGGSAQTRRQFLSLASLSVLRPQPVVVPVNVVTDGLARWAPRQLDAFWWKLWPDTCRQFGGCGIRLQSTATLGGVARPPGREPILTGLERGALNLVVTNRIPMEWDQGRTLSGVTLLYRSYSVCMIAMDHAHGLQVPLLSVNTCTHEILHALLLDIFEEKPPGIAGAWREFRVDWYATRLSFHAPGTEVRSSALRYVTRLAHSDGVAAAK
ncbi:MAG TPA: hypothetical protein VG456_09970 [Candidatus Sulfopaludibacter sp.]|jgi:hypothetical protein|nr:hypothetical protein [Candidatus Sulfopaludibacter sp.]